MCSIVGPSEGAEYRGSKRKGREEGILHLMSVYSFRSLPKSGHFLKRLTFCILILLIRFTYLFRRYIRDLWGDDNLSSRDDTSDGDYIPPPSWDVSFLYLSQDHELEWWTYRASKDQSSHLTTEESSDYPNLVHCPDKSGLTSQFRCGTSNHGKEGGYHTYCQSRRHPDYESHHQLISISSGLSLSATLLE